MREKKFNEVLRTWLSLNHILVIADEELCKELLRAELSGRRRQLFVLRIHSRLNRVRAHREREELKGKVQ